MAKTQHKSVYNFFIIYFLQCCDGQSGPLSGTLCVCAGCAHNVTCLRQRFRPEFCLGRSFFLFAAEFSAEALPRAPFLHVWYRQTLSPACFFGVAAEFLSVFSAAACLFMSPRQISCTGLCPGVLSHGSKTDFSHGALPRCVYLCTCDRHSLSQAGLFAVRCDNMRAAHFLLYCTAISYKQENSHPTCRVGVFFAVVLPFSLYKSGKSPARYCFFLL